MCRPLGEGLLGERLRKRMVDLGGQDWQTYAISLVIAIIQNQLTDL